MEGVDCLRIPRCGISTDDVRKILRERTSRYFLLDISRNGNVSIGDANLQRLLDEAVRTSAGIVFSDLYREVNGTVSAFPLADWQIGSVRDDFDFGELVLVSREAADYYLSTELENLHFAGFYQFRLLISERFPVVHIGACLYSAVENDGREAAKKQFDYVDPKNREVQIEMEKACTEHLKRIGALLSADCLEQVDYTTGDGFAITASIIIPVRNRARTIRDAVMSALAQETDFAFNVIAVDNHSTDGTGEILDEIAAKDSRLIHIVPEASDLGIGGCWNLAVCDSRCGRFAVQLDSDDLYSSTGTLRTVISKFLDEGCAMVVGSYRMCDFSLATIPPGLIDHSEWTDSNGFNNALRINGLGAPRAFYTPILRDTGFPNVSYGEDYAVGLAICGRYRIGRIYDELYLCRRWDGNSDAVQTPETIRAHNTYKDSLRTAEVERRIRENRKRSEAAYGK